MKVIFFNLHFDIQERDHVYLHANILIEYILKGFSRHRYLSEGIFQHVSTSMPDDTMKIWTESTSTKYRHYEIDDKSHKVDKIGLRDCWDIHKNAIVDTDSDLKYADFSKPYFTNSYFLFKKIISWV